MGARKERGGKGGGEAPQEAGIRDVPGLVTRPEIIVALVRDIESLTGQERNNALEMLVNEFSQELSVLRGLCVDMEEVNWRTRQKRISDSTTISQTIFLHYLFKLDQPSKLSLEIEKPCKASIVFDLDESSERGFYQVEANFETKEDYPNDGFSRVTNEQFVLSFFEGKTILDTVKKEKTEIATIEIQPAEEPSEGAPTQA